MLEKLKWTGTILLMVGVGGVSAGFYPFIYVQLLGSFCWLISAFMMKDKALITNNVFVNIIMVSGIIFKFITGV